ncbi:F-box protein-like [Striga asiatica]|uniref:F-box protein-like n=1 Tax=Striga asiatica TaxID=4170 RepID=A0A5A7P3C2_STRAF|nr:F-box protein-like [Striga asiatica]
MGEESIIRKWDELIPDALGLIFKNLSFVELLTVVPRVCKSWGKTVAGPYCWQEIDIEEWSKNRNPEIIDRMLRLLISRSGGSPRKLTVSGLTNDQSFLFIANHAQSLHTLSLTRCSITDSITETISMKLSSLSSLDLSYCNNLGAPALESIGKSCKSLTTLRRVMHPLEVISMHSQEDEARAIATTMTKLEHLEMAYMLVTTSSVLEILRSCKRLTLLDIRGCWNVELDERVVKRFWGKLKVLGPDMVGCYEAGEWEWDDWSEESGGYLAWDFVAGDLDGDDDYYAEEVATAFWEEDGEWPYEGGEGFDWPHSP